jgi:hypothetical protein
MKKGYVLLLVPILLAVVLGVSIRARSGMGTEQTIASTKEIEYAKLVFMNDECIGWFSPQENIIGRADVAEYFKENRVKPEEGEILKHFASLGWELDKKIRKDKDTTEYQLKRKG